MRLVLAVAAALLLAAPVLASEERPTLAELESRLVCPTCNAPLDQSSSAVADRMRFYIRSWIAAGDSRSEIERKMVDQFGERVLADPPKRGFNLLAWLLPLGGIALGAGATGVAAWRWSRGQGRDERSDPSADATGARVHLEPELERRLDEALARFDG